MREIPAVIIQTLDTVCVARTVGERLCEVCVELHKIVICFTRVRVTSYSYLLKNRPVISTFKASYSHKRTVSTDKHIVIIVYCDLNQILSD